MVSQGGVHQTHRRGRRRGAGFAQVNEAKEGTEGDAPARDDRNIIPRLSIRQTLHHRNATGKLQHATVQCKAGSERLSGCLRRAPKEGLWRCAVVSPVLHRKGAIIQHRYHAVPVVLEGGKGGLAAHKCMAFGAGGRRRRRRRPWAQCHAAEIGRELIEGWNASLSDARFSY